MAKIFVTGPLPGLTPASFEEHDLYIHEGELSTEALYAQLADVDVLIAASTLSPDLGDADGLRRDHAGGRAGQMAGRSPYMQAVNFVGDESQIGQIVPCKLSAARQNSMTGEILAIKGAA